MKTCTKCNMEKEICNFSKNKNYKDGMAYHCKACVYSTCRAWLKNNRESAANSSKKWLEKNTEKHKMAVARWQGNNQDKRNSTEAKRRAKKLHATPNWLTECQLAEIQEFYALCKELQWLSDPSDVLSVDHIVPLQGENVSGLHVPWNLQILPKSLNSSKNNKVLYGR